MKRKSIFLIVFISLSLPFKAWSLASSGPAIKAALKKLTKSMDDVAAAAFIKKYAPQMAQIKVTHGKQAIKAVENGGVKLFDVAKTYGDDVWRMVSQVPNGARALVVDPKRVWPLCQKYGDDVLKLEAKAPGLTKQAVAEFGDDGLKYLANHVKGTHVAPLIGYAAKANNSATKRLLLDKYKAFPGLLERLNPAQVNAVGLSAAMIITATGVSIAGNAVAEGVKDSISAKGKATAEVLKENPEMVERLERHGTSTRFQTVATLGTVAIVALLAFYVIRLRRTTPQAHEIPPPPEHDEPSASSLIKEVPVEHRESDAANRISKPPESRVEPHKP